MLGQLGNGLAQQSTIGGSSSSGSSGVGANQTALNWAANNHISKTLTFQQWNYPTNPYVFYQGGGTSGIVRGMLFTCNEPQTMERNAYHLIGWTDLGTLTDFSYNSLITNTPDFDIPIGMLFSERLNTPEANVVNVQNTPYILAANQTFTSINQTYFHAKVKYPIFFTNGVIVGIYNVKERRFADAKLTLGDGTQCTNGVWYSADYEIGTLPSGAAASRLRSSTFSGFVSNALGAAHIFSAPAKGEVVSLFGSWKSPFTQGFTQTSYGLAADGTPIASLHGDDATSSVNYSAFQGGGEDMFHNPNIWAMGNTNLYEFGTRNKILINSGAGIQVEQYLNWEDKDATVWFTNAALVGPITYDTEYLAVYYSDKPSVSRVDTTAASFLAANSISDATRSNAITHLVANLKRGPNPWARTISCWPFAGAGDATVNSKDILAAHDITWTGSAGVNLFHTNGIAGDGSVGFGDTGLIPSAESSLATNRMGIALYCDSRQQTNSIYMGSSDNTGTAMVGAGDMTGVVYPAVFQAKGGIGAGTLATFTVTSANFDTSGSLFAFRANSNKFAIYGGAYPGTTRNVDETVSGTKLSTKSLYILAGNNNGSASGFSKASISVAMVGAYTENDWATIRYAMDVYDREMGRIKFDDILKTMDTDVTNFVFAAQIKNPMAQVGLNEFVSTLKAASNGLGVVWTKMTNAGCEGIMYPMVAESYYGNSLNLCNTTKYRADFLATLAATPTGAASGRYRNDIYGPQLSSAYLRTHWTNAVQNAVTIGAMAFSNTVANTEAALLGAYETSTGRELSIRHHGSAGSFIGCANDVDPGVLTLTNLNFPMVTRSAAGFESMYGDGKFSVTNNLASVAAPVDEIWIGGLPQNGSANFWNGSVLFAMATRTNFTMAEYQIVFNALTNLNMRLSRHNPFDSNNPQGTNNNTFLDTFDLANVASMIFRFDGNMTGTNVTGSVAWTNGSRINIWPDMSANAFHASNDQSGQVYWTNNPAQLNALGGVRFTGGQRLTNQSAGTFNQTNTFFVVSTFPANLDGYIMDGLGAGRNVLGSISGNTNWDMFAGTQVSERVPAGVPALGVVSWQYSGAQSFIWTNNVLVTNGANAGALAFGPKFCIGARTNSNFGDETIYYIVGYNRDPSAAEKTNIFRWLANRFAIKPY